MSVAQVRVELRTGYGKVSRDQADRAFKSMMSTFKRQVSERNILLDFKNKQTYETKSQKIRRKRKEAIIRKKKEAGLGTRLRENFISREQNNA